MIRNLTFRLHELLPYVNWIYFFHAWGISPKFASVSEVHDCPACRQSWIHQWDEEDWGRAVEAEKLYRDAVSLLRHLDGKYLVYTRFGLFPAWSEGDDVIVFPDEKSPAEAGTDIVSQNQQGVRLPFLRQQSLTSDGAPCLCLSDFIAPKEYFQSQSVDLTEFPVKASTPRGCALGIFVTAVDREMEKLFPEDDYQKMLLQTLADRMAEAAAEKMHEEIRRKYWGYAPDEHFCARELFAEKYEGRRPAVGYPSIPDQGINFLLDEIIQMNKIGVELTESGMMTPHAAVSGLLFDHPACRHFSVGNIGEDQLQDYAGRRNYSISQCRKFLSANLRKG